MKKLGIHIDREFNIPIWIEEGHIDLSVYYDAERLQYNADKLLHEVASRFSKEDAKCIGLFNVDLFTPIFTHIFGQAILGGSSAIVSDYRLNNERYGMARSQEVSIERLCKEVIHELGHTFGLIHCNMPDCVMRSGSYVEDIDQKSASFCPYCKEKISDLKEE